MITVARVGVGQFMAVLKVQFNVVRSKFDLKHRISDNLKRSKDAECTEQSDNYAFQNDLECRRISSTKSANGHIVSTNRKKNTGWQRKQSFS